MLAGVAALTAMLSFSETHRFIHGRIVPVVYLAFVVFVASAWGKWPAFGAALASAVALDYFFLPPVYTFVTTPEHWVLVVAFVLTGMLAGKLSERAHRRAIEAERSRAEIARLYSEASTIVETTPDCVQIVSPEGILLFTNTQGLALIGASSAEATVGKSVFDIIAPEDRVRFRDMNDRICRGEGKATFEFDIVGLNGVRRNIETHAASLRSADGTTVQLAIMRDLTERKRAEHDSLLLGSIVGSSDDAIISKNLDGIITSWNQGAERLFGYAAAEAIGKPITILIPVDRLDEEPQILTRLRRGERVDHFETVRHRKDGSLLDISLTISPVKDARGRIIGASKIARDITQRKRVEQELEASRAQMVASARLSALGMMAGGIAHEINNPLAVIRGSAENISRMAESGSLQVARLLKNCNRISKTADRIARIVLSLRHVAREGSADEFRETPMREIVEETLALCAERFRANHIRLVVPVVDPAALVSCRETEICQVFLNLLQNAFDELVDLEGERWVKLEVTYSSGWVVFSVSDSGPGIAPENRAHLMEPFFTTKPVGKGTGLGLSISRSIALEHGGTLELDKQSPHTCFRLTLPLSGKPKSNAQLKNAS